MKRIEVKNSRKYALIIIDIYGIRPFQLQYCCILYVLQVWKSLLKVTRYSLWVALAINTRAFNLHIFLQVEIAPANRC